VGIYRGVNFVVFAKHEHIMQQVLPVCTSKQLQTQEHYINITLNINKNCLLNFIQYFCSNYIFDSPNRS
jgi:hypothetical protein